MSRPKDQTEGIWISSEPCDDGSYVATVSVDGDRIWALSPFKLRRYAAGALRAVAEAEYEAAIFVQLRDAGAPADSVFAAIAAFRHLRPANAAAKESSLRYEPGLTAAGKPFLLVIVDDQAVGQLTPELLRRHAAFAYEAEAVGDLDATYRKILREVVELSEEEALEAVSDLSSFRKEYDG